MSHKGKKQRIQKKIERTKGQVLLTCPDPPPKLGECDTNLWLDMSLAIKEMRKRQRKA